MWFGKVVNVLSAEARMQEQSGGGRRGVDFGGILTQTCSGLHRKRCVNIRTTFDWESVLLCTGSYVIKFVMHTLHVCVHHKRKTRLFLIGYREWDLFPVKSCVLWVSYPNFMRAQCIFQHIWEGDTTTSVVHYDLPTGNVHVGLHITDAREANSNNTNLACSVFGLDIRKFPKRERTKHALTTRGLVIWRQNFNGLPHFPWRSSGESYSVLHLTQKKLPKKCFGRWNDTLLNFSQLKIMKTSICECLCVLYGRTWCFIARHAAFYTNFAQLVLKSSSVELSLVSISHSANSFKAMLEISDKPLWGWVRRPAVRTQNLKERLVC